MQYLTFLALLCASLSSAASVIEQSFSFTATRSGGPQADLFMRPDGQNVVSYELTPFDERLGVLDSVTLSMESTWANGWALNFYLPGFSGDVIVPAIHRLDVLGIEGLQLPTGNGTLSCTNTLRVCNDVLTQSGDFDFTVELAPDDWASEIQLRAFLSRGWTQCTTTSGTTYALSLGIYTECVLLQDASNGVDFKPIYRWDGIVTAAYNYTPFATAPEPAGLALLGVLSLLGIRFRSKDAGRQRAAKPAPQALAG